MRMENVESNAESSVPLNTQYDELDSSEEQNVSTLTAEETREYRNALGKFSTGVAIVTVNTSEGPIGITINSFASVSMSPSLILWSVAKHAGRYEVFKNAAAFSIQVLAENQYQEAMHFAKNANGSSWSSTGLTLDSQEVLCLKISIHYSTRTYCTHCGRWDTEII